MSFTFARGRTSQLIRHAISVGSARRSLTVLSTTGDTSSASSFSGYLLHRERQWTCHVHRRMCHNSSNDPDAAIEENVKETALVQQEGFDASPSRINVPDVWPNVPIIAINRYPLFPGFIKRVDIVRDEALKELLRRKIKSRHPYVGVFVKRNDDFSDKSESVTSIGELYPVGSFAHVLEVHDQNVVVELLLNAHRRIRILEALDESLEPRTPHISKINGRRTPGGKKSGSDFPLAGGGSADGAGGGRKKRRDAAASPADETLPPPAVEEKRLIYARTENIITDPFERTAEIKASMMAIIQAVRDIVSYNQFFGQQINLLLHPSQNVSENPIYLCDLVATLVHSAETTDLQQMMEETNLHRRLQLAIELLEKEKTIAKLTHQIGKDVEKKVQDHHRRYLLGEQLKSIKKELGIEKDEKQTIIEKLEERLKGLNVPEHAMNVIKEEQTKLGFLDPHSSEFSVARNYLDWLTNIPWGKTTEESLRLDAAAKILDEDHYGMKDVKDRILEFIAVGILKQKISGKILCFHGPPGVGKTSIAKSIARALNRKYYRFSVGGMTDVAEIKGHRRTYIGAMPGKIIQCLKKVQCENPLVLIDEVDKIGGAGFHGDPASALLELLDPEQNANFMDHFLDVPVDLSKVLFICTANVLDTIPEALADRMEMIEVSGYVADEKIKIADRYLIPQCREDCNLPAEKLQIEDDAIERIIKNYCRESGVRNLQKHLEKIFRKAAFIITGKADTPDKTAESSNTVASSSETANVASGELLKSLPADLSGEGDAEAQRTGDDLSDIPTDPIVVNTSNLRQFLGREKFTSDRMYDRTPPGVIMGLAWTSMGGSALYIETSLCQRLRNGNKPVNVVGIDATAVTPLSSPMTAEGKSDEGAHEQPGSLAIMTGRLGDVMKESMQTAYTVAKNTLMRRVPDNSFLHSARIHVHVPEGATPKDGPSAGCTIASALISLALDTPAIQDLAMTGEISLTGKVLPVGGIREKVIAAKRADVRTVLLPSENKKDFDDLPEFIRRGVDVHFVDHYDEVFDLIFPDYKQKTSADV